MCLVFVRVSDSIRIRHPAGHHGEGRTKQLAGQRHLRRKLQRCQLPTTAGGSGPETGEEVCDRPRGGETAEHAGTGDATITPAFSSWVSQGTSCLLKSASATEV